MRLTRVRCRLRGLTIAVAIVACVMGSAFAFSVEPKTAENVLTGWAARYGIPIILIPGWRVPL